MTVNSEPELASTNLTGAQIEMVREAVAIEAAQIAAIGVTPKAIKFSRIKDDKAKLAEFVGGASTLIRYSSFKYPRTHKWRGRAGRGCH